MDRIFVQTFRRALEETREAFSDENKMTDPAMAIARLSDVSRSNSFLWVETWLRLQEHFSRTARVGLAWSRILVLMTLKAMGIIFTEIARIEPDVQLQPILDYLKGTLPLELDFRREAAAMTELQAALRHRADVLVPTAIPERCTERLLAMEFIDGIKITDRTTLLNAGISLPAVARLLNDLYAEQMLRLGVLHADPHPGNLLVQPGPKLVLLDHGLTVRLTPSLVHALTEIVRTLVALDFDGLTKALAEAGLQLDEQVDITSLMQLVGVLLGEEPTSSAVDVGVQLSRSVGHIPVDLLMVGRALGLLDGITKQLDPDLDTLQIVAAYCAPRQ
jgi:ubiquinone biosynthesis protein